MLPYIFLISTVLLFSLICFNKSTKNNVYPQVLKSVFLSVCFLLLFVYSAVRANIGYDYLMYHRGFLQMGADGFASIAYLDWELGFTVLTKAIYLLTKNIHVYMAIIAAVCLAGPFYVIYRYSKAVWLSVLLYINLYFFYCTFNFLRQSIAISIALFAYTALINRKFWQYAALIMFAALFHQTVLILLPVYFIVNFKPSLKIPLLYAYGVLWVFIASNATLDIIMDFIDSDYRQSVFLTKGLDYIHVVIPTLIIGCGIFFVLKCAKSKNNDADPDKIIIIQTNLMYFSYFWICVMLRHALFERLSYYTYIYVILYIPEMLAFADEQYKKHLNKKFDFMLKNNELSEIQQQIIIARFKRRRNRLNVFLTLIIIAVTLLYNIYGLAAYEKGVHGVYPYASWFKF